MTPSRTRPFRPTMSIAILVVFLLSATAARGEDPLALVLGMDARFSRVKDYTATVSRTERLPSGRTVSQTMFLKVQPPGRLYVRWVTGPPKGRELLFVKGRDADRALVHEPGVLSDRFTILTAPNGPLILNESRHPVTDVGIGRMVELILANVRRASQAGDLEIRERSSAGEGDRPGRWIDLVFPRDPVKGYYAYRAEILVDDALGLPVELKVFDWGDALVEHYAYHDVRLNPGLTERDFDLHNPDYTFADCRLTTLELTAMMGCLVK